MRLQRGIDSFMIPLIRSHTSPDCGIQRDGRHFNDS